jgi:nucleoside-diphosphate-sugar epimerase
MVKVMITGGTGFVGTHLVSHLAARPGYRVGVIKRPSSQVSWSPEAAARVECFDAQPDGENLPGILASFQPEVVVHLASLFLGQHRYGDIKNMVEANIGFGTQLLDAMARADVRLFLNTSTHWEHQAGGTKYRPANLYAATKKAFEDILVYYAKTHHLTAVTFKLFDTYGPFDRRRKLFSFFKEAIGAKTPVDFTPGEQELDLLYVRDLARAYEAGLQYLRSKKDDGYEAFFVGSGQKRTLRQVAGVFEKAYQQKLNINWGGRSYREKEIMKLDFDLRPTFQALSWIPEFSLEQGMAAIRQEELS